MNPTDPQFQPILPDAPEPQQPMQPTPQSMDVVAPPPVAPIPAEQPIQMPPYAPAQPPIVAGSPEPIDTIAPVMPMPETAPVTHPEHHKTDVLGILSIVSILFGILPVGLILGLVGASHAKKSHTSPVVSRIGWILNLIIMLLAIPVFVFLVLGNFQGAQAKARDTERAHDLGVIETKLEDYFKENFGYPNNLDDIGITDKQSLVGPSGSTITVNDVADDEAAAKATSNPTGAKEYIYTPYGKPTCLETCDGYVLKGYVEKPNAGVTNPLVKLGLENL